MTRESLSDFMVEKLFWKDQYMKAFNATVVGSEGGIELDRTAFYPTGGGQPCDFGTLSFGDSKIKIVDVRKDGDRIIHLPESDISIDPGTQIVGEIDWDRRYAHMKYHTLLHIVDGVVEKYYGGKVTGGQIYQDRARMDFDIPMMDRQKADDIAARTQKVIDERHTVTQKFLSVEEAASIPNLSRTLPGNELLKKLDSIRVIDIEGFDMQLDGGTHVANTSEVGRIKLSSYESRGAHSKRVTFVIES